MFRQSVQVIGTAIAIMGGQDTQEAFGRQPEGGKVRERPRMRWKKGLTMLLGVGERRSLITDRRDWARIVEEAQALEGFYPKFFI